MKDERPIWGPEEGDLSLTESARCCFFSLVKRYYNLNNGKLWLLSDFLQEDVKCLFTPDHQVPWFHPGPPWWISDIMGVTQRRRMCTRLHTWTWSIHWQLPYWKPILAWCFMKAASLMLPDHHLGSSIEQSVLPSDVYHFYNLRERPCEFCNFHKFPELPEFP